MKRLIVVLCVAGLLAALSMSHLAMAAKPEEKPAKVAICHVNSANDVLVDLWGGVAAFGRVIEVPENAVAAHEAHGDSTDFVEISEEFRDLTEEFFGISLPNANCTFLVLVAP